MDSAMSGDVFSEILEEAQREDFGDPAEESAADAEEPEEEALDEEEADAEEPSDEEKVAEEKPEEAKAEEAPKAPELPPIPERKVERPTHSWQQAVEGYRHQEMVAQAKARGLQVAEDGSNLNEVWAHAYQQDPLWCRRVEEHAGRVAEEKADAYAEAHIKPYMEQERSIQAHEAVREFIEIIPEAAEKAFADRMKVKGVALLQKRPELRDNPIKLLTLSFAAAVREDATSALKTVKAKPAAMESGGRRTSRTGPAKKPDLVEQVFSPINDPLAAFKR